MAISSRRTDIFGWRSWDDVMGLPAENITFRPSFKEFEKMDDYILKTLAYEDVEKYGVVKITPPAECFIDPRSRPYNVQGVGEKALGDAILNKSTIRRINHLSAQPLPYPGTGIFELLFEAEDLRCSLADFAYRARQHCAFEPFCRDVSKAADIFWDTIGTEAWRPLYAPDLPNASLFKSMPKPCKLWNMAGFEDDYIGRVFRDGYSKAEDNYIAGVHTPTMIIGAAMSCFAAHTESKDLFAMNYLHGGWAKVWYVIFKEDAGKFEKVANAALKMNATRKSRLQTCDNVVKHKRWLFSPKFLTMNDIRFTRVVQEPGDYILIYPRGYHQGFNLGFNLAETRNFTLPKWLPTHIRSRGCNCRENEKKATKKGQYDDTDPLPPRDIPLPMLPFVIDAWKPEDVRRYIRGEITGPDTWDGLPGTPIPPSLKELKGVLHKNADIEALIAELEAEEEGNVSASEHDTSMSTIGGNGDDEEEDPLKVDVDEYDRSVVAQLSPSAVEKRTQEGIERQEAIRKQAVERRHVSVIELIPGGHKESVEKP